MKNKILILLALAVPVMGQTPVPVRPVVVDQDGNVQNSLTNFPTGGLQINGMDVGTGSGGGGTGVTSLTLAAPSALFTNPTNFTINSTTGVIGGTMTFVTQPANQFFGNFTNFPATPQFGSAADAKGALGLAAVATSGDYLDLANRPATAGTVTSINLSTPTWLTATGGPITASGSITLSSTAGLAQGLFLATPASGTGALAPRAIAASDVPILPYLLPANNLSELTNVSAARTKLGLDINTNVQAYDAGLSSISGVSTVNRLYYLSANDVWSPVALGTNLSFDISTGTLNATAGGGGVASVGLALPSLFAVTNSPVTGSGTLTGTFATQAANLVFAGPASGVAAAPAMRSLVSADIPNLTATKITSGTFPAGVDGTNLSNLNPLSLSSPIPATLGGTGLATALTSGSFFVGNGTSPMGILAGNISSGRRYLTSTGNGSVNTSTSFNTIPAIDITGLASVATTGAYGDLTGKPTTISSPTFSATTSAELAGVLSDETGSGGGFVRATGPTIDSLNLTGTSTGVNLTLSGTMKALAYQSSDGTAGASATTGGATFKNGLYTSGTISAGGGATASTDLSDSLNLARLDASNTFARTSALLTNQPTAFNQTWNASGVTFTGIRENITSTGSAVGSLLLDLQLNGVTQFSVNKTGTIFGSLPITSIQNYQTTTLNLPASTVDKIVGYDSGLATPTFAYFNFGTGFSISGVAGSKTVSVPAHFGLFTDPVIQTATFQLQRLSPTAGGTPVPVNIPNIPSTTVTGIEDVNADASQVVQYIKTDGTQVMTVLPNTSPIGSGGSGLPSAYKVLVPTGAGSAGAVTWNTDPVVINNAAVTLTATSTALATTDAQDGTQLNLEVTQGSGAGGKALTLPSGSRTGANGAGLVTLSSTAGFVDLLQGTVVGSGNNQHILWRQPVLNLSSVAAVGYNTFTEDSLVNAVTNAGGSSLTPGYSSIHTIVAGRYTPNIAGTVADYTMGRIDLDLETIGSPTYDLSIQIRQAATTTLTTASNPGEPGPIISVNSLDPSKGASNTVNSTIIPRYRTIPDAVSNGSATLTSAAGSFVTVSDQGAKIFGTNIPPGTTIATVSGPTTILMSASSTGAVSGVSIGSKTISFTGFTAPISTAGRTLTNGTTAVGNASIASTTAAFTVADIGSPVISSAFPTNTVISAIVDGGNATASKNATSAGTGTITFTLRPVYYVQLTAIGAPGDSTNYVYWEGYSGNTGYNAYRRAIPQNSWSNHQTGGRSVFKTYK